MRSGRLPQAFSGVNTRKALRRKQISMTNFVLDSRACILYIVSNKPVTRKSTRSARFSESRRWWECGMRGRVEWTAEGGANGLGR